MQSEIILLGVDWVVVYIDLIPNPLSEPSLPPPLSVSLTLPQRNGMTISGTMGKRQVTDVTERIDVMQFKSRQHNMRKMIS